jgi:hypothetical protein
MVIERFANEIKWNIFAKQDMDMFRNPATQRIVHATPERRYLFLSVRILPRHGVDDTLPGKIREMASFLAVQSGGDCEAEANYIDSLCKAVSRFARKCYWYRSYS